MKRYTILVVKFMKCFKNRTWLLLKCLSKIFCTRMSSEQHTITTPLSLEPFPVAKECVLLEFSMQHNCFKIVNSSPFLLQPPSLCIQRIHVVKFCVSVSILVSKASLLILSPFNDRQTILHSFDLFHAFHALLFD